MSIYSGGKWNLGGPFQFSGGGSAPVTSLASNGATATFTPARQGWSYADGSQGALVGGTLTALTPAYSALGTATFVVNPGNTTLASGAIISGTAATARKVNGAMVNPGNKSYASGGLAANNAKGPNTQGFDGLGDMQAMVYTASLNVDPIASGSAIDISTEKTILKAVITGHTIDTDSGGDVKAVVDRYAPFTFAAVAPAADAYRPGIARTSKVSLFKRSDVDLTVLPSLTWPGGGYGSLPDIAALTAKFSDPYYLAFTQNTGAGGSERVLMPVGGSGAQSNYGRDIAHDVGKALLCLCMSDYSSAQKLALIDQLVPQVNDITARIEEGGIFKGIGGGEAWRKGPVAFIARLMRNSANYSYLAGYAANTTAFAEDTQIQVAGDALLAMTPGLTVSNTSSGAVTMNVGDTVAFTAFGTGYGSGQTLTLGAADVNVPTTFTIASVSGSSITSLTLTTLGSNWKSYVPRASTPLTGGTGTGATIGLRSRDKYAPFMRGQADWGESSISTGKPGANDDAEYRAIVSGPMCGIILACELISGGETLWGRAGTFEYYERYYALHKADARGDGEQISVIAGAMWDTYRPARYAGAAPSRTALKADGAFVWIETNQLINESITPSTSDFAVNVGGSPATINYVRIFGKNVGLRLATPLTSSATAVTIAYTQGTNKLTSVDGQLLASFAATAATNVTGQLPAPVASMAMVNNNATAYSKLNGFGSDVGVNRIWFIFKFRRNSYVANAPIYYKDNNTRLYFPATGSLRHLFLASTKFQQTTTGISDSADFTFFQAIDFTALSLTTLGLTFLNNTQGVDPSSGDITGIYSFNMNSLLNSDIGLLYNLSTLVADMRFEWGAIDWGSSLSGFTNPDFTNSTYRNTTATTANLNNTNGQSLTTHGGAPKIFIMGNTIEFNDVDVGSLNRGTSPGKSLTPVGGVYS